MPGSRLPRGALTATPSDALLSVYMSCAPLGFSDAHRLQTSPTKGTCYSSITHQAWTDHMLAAVAAGELNLLQAHPQQGTCPSVPNPRLCLRQPSMPGTWSLVAHLTAHLAGEVKTTVGT